LAVNKQKTAILVLIKPGFSHNQIILVFRKPTLTFAVQKN